MNFPKLRLRVLPKVYAICSFDPDAAFPGWTHRSSILSITKTPKEITLVCEENHVPGECKKSEHWKCIKVEGRFDLDAVGVLASIAGPLAQNKISLYVISTYDTDYVLIQTKNIDKAMSCLDKFGHTFIDLEEEA
ncbi:ACT domain-containing protein [Planctomycetota bacterium]